MPITSAAGLIDALRDYRVLEPAQLLELTGDLQSRYPDSRAMARELLQRSWVTAYQVNQLLQGRGAELVLGPYLLLERLGEGGMGQVFKARHQLMNRTVALKVIRKERLAHPDAVQRFHREIRATAQLDHPHLVRAYDAAQVGEIHILVMEYAEGTDLQRLIQKSGPLPVTQACAYIRQAALGLQHASERGLVHRDIKPSNLQVTAQGTVVKVLDMGLARSQVPDGVPGGGNELTQARTVLGTPDYIAPEQIDDPRRVDIRADIYSLGCTFYFALAGRPPFPDGAWEEKLVCHRKVEPQPIEQVRPDVFPAIGAVLRKMMAKFPEDRYLTPAAVAEALTPFCPISGPLPVARPLPSTMAVPKAPGSWPATTTPPVAQSAGYEAGWTLEANSTFSAPPAAASPVPQAALLSEPTMLVPGQNPPSPALGRPPLGALAQLIAGARKQRGLVLAGGGAILVLLILLLIWLKGGNTDGKGKDQLALDTKGASDSGKGKDKDKPKPADSGKGKDKDKPKPDPPKELIDEDFRTAFEKGRGLPVGWKGDAFRVVEDDDRHCLEVSKESGHHFVTLPPLKPTLSGNFYIEGEYLFERSFGRFGEKGGLAPMRGGLLVCYAGASHLRNKSLPWNDIDTSRLPQPWHAMGPLPQPAPEAILLVQRKRKGDIPNLTIELKDRKGNGSLSIDIDFLGNVKIDDDRRTAPPNYKPGKSTRFRLTREGKTLRVKLNNEVAADKDLDEAAEYDSVRVGMPARGQWIFRFELNAIHNIRAKLYSLKVGR